MYRSKLTECTLLPLYIQYHSCCGLDVHKDIVEACIIKGTLETPEKIQEQFKTTRQELLRMVAWLTCNACYHIAMESTGVYWRPVYEADEEHSPRYDCMMVVNAHHMRNLPGRKSDVKDAEWIATLMRHGLLEPSFVPNRIIRDIREFSRLRKTIVKEKTDIRIIWKSFSKRMASSFHLY